MPASPACPVRVWQFFLARSGTLGRPGTDARARRRGPTRAGRPAIRSITWSGIDRHRAGATL
ncbi:hypothetical protein [Streptosporangium minutum]|uniref:hypothetical protein n=1 Tax=Streptosporangium minutum TaxID=569862 RepID=UPI0010544205|nr:hypothetical protein [Streptosporangium minutum]